MSYAVTPIAVDLDRVRGALGSKDKTLLAHLQQALADDLEQVDDMLADDDEEGEEPLTTADVLRHLVMGEPYRESDGTGFAYGYCFEALCKHFGERLGDNYWSGMRSAWFDAVQEALKQAGVNEKQFSICRLVGRGAPVKLPEIDDFPGIGYLTRAEVVGAREALAAADLTKVENGEAAEAIEQVRAWLDECARSGRDLVCTYA
jgi:hypothetical protein